MDDVYKMRNRDTSQSQFIDNLDNYVKDGIRCKDVV
jgi:hypothetical protein